MKVKDLIWTEEDENMGLYPPSKPTFVGVSEGTHIATCYFLADLGMQDSGQYGIKHQVHYLFEVPGERVEFTDENGNNREMPRTIGKTYNFTLTEGATLRKDLESWRGRAFTEAELVDPDGKPIFDITGPVGRPCQLAVVKAESGKSKIASIIGLPKGFQPPPMEHDKLIFDANGDMSNIHVPKWIRESLQSPQPVAQTQPSAVGDSLGHVNQDIPFDDDIPF